MRNYYGINLDEQRAALLAFEEAKPLIENVIKRADAALGQEYSALKFSDYMLFSKTGDRTTFQLPYFVRRNNCSYLAMAYWLTEDEKYKEPLEDLIIHICDEYSWCLPAHSLIWDPKTTNQMLHELDLHQGETGRMLTDIYLMVGEKLHYLVKDRIEYEVKRRVIESFKHKEFHWLKPTCKTNWASVCAGAALVAFMGFGTKEEIDSVLPALSQAIEHFLMGIGDDGCCMEGCSYWNYGFEYFVIFARLMLVYTNGEVNYFKRDKVKAIATFIQKARLTETKTISFSDCVPDFSFSPGLLSYLKTLYPDDVKLPSLKYGTRQGNIFAAKDLLWLSADYKEDPFGEGCFYLENAEWYIARYKKYSFAAKGGYNAEPHNHNDIGSFSLVTADGNMPLADLGAGEYTAFTFDPNYRYKMIEHASFGHSVPIINGKYQMFGAEYRTKNAKAYGNSFSFDMEGAYEEGLITRLNRRFELFPDRIILTDTAEYSPETESITERFVSTEKPTLSDGAVDFSGIKLLYDKEKFDAKLTEDSFINHYVKKTNVYLIDVLPKKEKETEFKFEIIIE